MLETITSFFVEHWDTILSVVGAASVLAAVVVKITPNTVDNKVLAIVLKLLDLAALNPKQQAELAGDKAVKANPPAGLGSVVGKPIDFD